MQDWGIPSILLEPDVSISTSSSSDFGSYAFATKANMKTLAVLHVLQYNYNPLLSDVDVVYFINPLDYLSEGGWVIQIGRVKEAGIFRSSERRVQIALVNEIVGLCSPFLSSTL